MPKIDGNLDRTGLTAIKKSMDVQLLIKQQRLIKRQVERLALDYLALGLPTRDVLSYVKDVLTDVELYLQKRLSVEEKALETSNVE